ncbi:aldehyde dehydrogenase family protein [Sphingobium sp. YG1]|uniref:aldehyde dehydrogenase family protein n=1 Tax=Sphingobium sp. YG1 TaxID=2082188 RepID=UPI000DBB5AD2|nr:aldehyde dehydrogenase family protein [Sphingobium sp. YG1]BBD01502.1 aldehyde dehydrogenase (NAD(+)) [Sphingobium sp. YG1]
MSCYEFRSQFIDGHWKDGSDSQASSDVDPFSGALLFEVRCASVEDVDAAYSAAATAQRSWAATSPAARSIIFRRAAEIVERRRTEIVDWLIRESGSTRIKAEIECRAVQEGMLEAASIPYRTTGLILPIDTPDTESRVYRKPIGVVAVISPWNFPLHLSHRTVGPALATGNAVVIKPAEETPITGGLLLARLYEEAGLPAGLLNVVTGSSRTIGDAFCTHDIPRFISFTGSTEVGRRIGRLAIEARVIKRVALELGGNNPLVVLDDADLDRAVEAATLGRFLHQGQICMSTNRVIVEAGIYDAFLARLVSAVEQVQHGDPASSGTLVGPAFNAKQFAQNMKHIEDARSRLRQVVGGDPVGTVIPPHIFADVENADPLAQTEMFGPILFVIKARDEDHALELANATEAGLSSAVFTQDEARGLRFALGIEAGMTHINDMTVADMPFNPFGGEKNSGMGRFGGDWIIEELTTTHWVTVRRPARVPVIS